MARGSLCQEEGGGGALGRTHTIGIVTPPASSPSPVGTTVTWDLPGEGSTHHHQGQGPPCLGFGEGGESGAPTRACWVQGRGQGLGFQRKTKDF